MDSLERTVGAILRTTREERGLSLVQASGVTRVRMQYLQALENDEPDLLPSKVQARGYLRLYADYLGLPVQPLLDAWPGGIPILSKQTPVEEETPTVVEEAIETEPEPALPEAHPVVLTPEELVEIPIVEELGPDAQSSGWRAIFRQIGSDLRQRRESISLSLQDVERFTKLRGHYITALEEGRVNDLPSLVQGRGMLANYAEFLDLDVDTYLTRFADALQARRLELLEAENQPQKDGRTSTTRQLKGAAVPTSGWRRFLTPDLMIGGTMFVLFFALVVWGAARVNELQAEELEATPPSISAILMSTSAPSFEPTLGLTSEPTAIPVATLNESIGFTPESVDLTATLPALPEAPLQVYIVASQRAWMRVIVDTSIAFQGRTIPGNAYPFTGRDRIELLTGDGSALQVVFNQQNLGTLGQTGEVVNLIFNKDGAMTPTTQFTPTPTITIRPTNTIRPTAVPSTPTVTPLIP